MNLFELFVKVGVDDQASGKLKSITSGLGKGLATAAKIGTAAVAAAAAGIVSLTKSAVESYAEYEQLVGGVETLFKTSADRVMEYAENAYKTAGISANEYMSTVTSFSASLLQSLSGDTEKAADYANRALIDMADNANKMGTSMEAIQTAYSGFSKQNYTMLDNLKLGYGGTKSEMERLIKDAAALNDIQAELGVTVDANSMSFGNIVNAISVMQEKMGIAGTTAKEAGTTIAGSVGSMKAAWSNLITGLADGSADIGGLIDNLVTTIVGDGTDSSLGVVGNVLPAIERALGGVVQLIKGAVPKIIEILPGLISDLLPVVVSGAVDLVNSVTEILPELLDTLVTAIVENAPALITAGIAVVSSLVSGIKNNYQVLIDGAISIAQQLITGIFGMMPQIMSLGMELLIALINGVTAMLSDATFIQSIVDIVLEIVDVLTNPNTITNLLNAAMTLIVALAKGLILALPQLLAKVPEIIRNLVKAFGNFLQPIIDIGKNIVDGIKKGISNAWNNLVQWFSKLFDDIIGIAKRILGIASPSKVFKKIGGFTAEGFGIGFEKEFAHVKDDMEDALSFDDATIGIDSSIRTISGGNLSGGTSIGNVNITVNGANYADEQSLAAAIALEIQNMTDRRAAVYA